MSKPWQPYALHILDAIAKVRRIRERGDITQDDVLYDATLRNLQTLSEATQSLPEELKAQFPEVPWRQISGFRNILTHNYLGNIDPMTVAAVVAQHLDPLEASISRCLMNRRTGRKRISCRRSSTRKSRACTWKRSA